MASAATNTRGAARRNPWLRRSLIAAVIVAALALGGAISLSKPFQQGSTRLFGKVVDGVKDHPRATAAIVLGGVATLWLAIGTMIAGQEFRNSRPQ
jgi:hypothetical protein